MVYVVRMHSDHSIDTVVVRLMRWMCVDVVITWWVMRMIMRR